MTAATDSPCLCDTLRRTMRVVTQHYDEALRPAGLRITQYSVLGYVSSGGETRVRDLAARLDLDDTTLTRSLRTLETNGWVTTRAGEDRRERLVSITATGRAMLAGAQPLWARAQETLAARVSLTTWEALFRTLPKIAEATG